MTGAYLGLEIAGPNKKHNGKPLHDRERLVRQSLENISRASLDVIGCPWASRGIFGSLWGVFWGLWGSLEIFGDLWGPEVLTNFIYLNHFQQV